MQDPADGSISAHQTQLEAVGAILTFMDFEGIVIDGQFHVRDTALGKRLGYDRPRKIRDLIERRMSQLICDGKAPHRGAPSAIDDGSDSETGEYYLNEDQALLVVRYSEAPKADEIYRLMITVFKAFLRGSQALTAEQALERLAADDTAFALATAGAELQLRKAAALKAEGQRIEDEALAVLGTRNDRLALRSASRQVLAMKDQLQPHKTVFGHQLLSLSVDAAVLWTVYDAGIQPTAIVDLLDRLELRFGRTVSPRVIHDSLVRLADHGIIVLKDKPPRAFPDPNDPSTLPHAKAVDLRKGPDTTILLDALDGPTPIFVARPGEHRVYLNPTAGALLMDNHPDEKALPGALRLVRAIFTLAADHRIHFRDGFVAVSPLARDESEDMNPFCGSNRPTLGDHQVATHAHGHGCRGAQGSPFGDSRDRARRLALQNLVSSARKSITEPAQGPEPHLM